MLGDSRPVPCWKSMCGPCSAGKKRCRSARSWRTAARPRGLSAHRPINSAMRNGRRSWRFATSQDTRACRRRRSCRGWPMRAGTLRRSRASIACCVTLSRSTDVAVRRRHAWCPRQTATRPRRQTRYGRGTLHFGLQYSRCILPPVYGRGHLQSQDRWLGSARAGVAYLHLVRGEIWIPSLSNSSLAMRSSPQDGLLRAISRMSARSSAGIRRRFAVISSARTGEMLRHASR